MNSRVPQGLALLCWITASGAAAQSIDMKAYWPQPDAGTTLIVRFDVGRMEFYRQAGTTYTLGDYWHRSGDTDVPATLIWSSTWHYRVDRTGGVVEFRDDLPGSSKQAVASSTFAPGNEISWGNVMRVGQTIDQKIAYVGHPAGDAFARHRLKFVAIFPTYQAGSRTFRNVIRLDDIQDICKQGNGGAGSINMPGPMRCPTISTSSATYYLAPGLGIIRIENAILDGKPDFVKAETVVAICTVSTISADAYCRP